MAIAPRFCTADADTCLALSPSTLLDDSRALERDLDVECVRAPTPRVRWGRSGMTERARIRQLLVRDPRSASPPIRVVVLPTTEPFPIRQPPASDARESEALRFTRASGYARGRPFARECGCPRSRSNESFSARSREVESRTRFTAVLPTLARTATPRSVAADTRAWMPSTSRRESRVR